MTVIVTKTEINPFDRIRWACKFIDGTTNVVVATEFLASCGCMCEVGIRVDKAHLGESEKAWLSSPCDEHRPHWGEILARLFVDDRETEIALAAAING